MKCLILTEYGSIVVAIATIGKWTVAAAFLYDYFWSSEVFPSTLRVSLVGISSTCSRIGTLLSPIVVDLVCWHCYELHVKTLRGFTVLSTCLLLSTCLWTLH